jgi:FkbM family methyltransferase
MHTIRKFIQRFGLDIHIYRPGPDRFSYLQTFDIQTVLDIGANVGQFAKEIRQLLPAAKIYSFEPIKECFEQLNENMKGDRNFKSFNFALGDKNEKAAINKSSYTPSSSILEMTDAHKTFFPHTKENKPEQIEVKRLDDIIRSTSLEKKILIKVDVQGLEDKVIAGGMETFKKAGVVLIENSFVELYKGQPLFDDIYEKMKYLGFVYGGNLQEKLDKKTGRIISEDSLFIKPR